MSGSILDDGQFFIGYDTQIEVVRTGAGNDNIIGHGGAAGHCEVYSGAGDDVINIVSAESSIVRAGNGNDIIKGGAGNDQLFGDAGDDILIGQAGYDKLTGGAGHDTFVFENQFDGSIDEIIDFGAGDTIQLDDDVFSALSGKTVAEAFSSGHLKYEQSSGELAYDSDGYGAANAVHFATLSNHFDLTAQSIEIVA